MCTTIIFLGNRFAIKFYTVVLLYIKINSNYEDRSDVFIFYQQLFCKTGRIKYAACFVHLLANNYFSILELSICKYSKFYSKYYICWDIAENKPG